MNQKWRTYQADGEVGSPTASAAADGSIVSDVEAVALVARDFYDGVDAVDVALVLARFDDLDDAVGVLRQRRTPVGIVCGYHWHMRDDYKESRGGIPRWDLNLS